MLPIDIVKYVYSHLGRIGTLIGNRMVRCAKSQCSLETKLVWRGPSTRSLAVARMADRTAP